MFGLAADEEKEQIPGTALTYRAQADILRRKGSYKKAIDLYTTALGLEPDDRSSLVCRSKCYLMLGDNAKALKDAEASLVEDKNYHRGIFQKAEALFNQGDFEMALVFYHRGHNIRPELHNFRQGIRKAQEAIYNSVGTPDRVKLNTTGDLSFFQPADEKKARNKGSGCTKKERVIMKRVPPTEKPANQRTIKQMLGDLYGDRIYLEKLLRQIDDTTTTGKNVRNLALGSLSYLNKKTDFWQQIKPIYARKYEARLAMNKVKSNKIYTHDYVIHDLEKIDVMMAGGQFEAALKRGLKLLDLLDKYPEHQLSSKMLFLAAVHSAIGSAYFELKDFVNAEKHHYQDLALGVECYIDEAERRALDNLGKVYVGSGNFRKAITVWERKLPMSKDPLEITWLCHELGRCYLSLGEHRRAKAYGEQSLASAKKAKDDRWQLHALVLISMAEAKARRLCSSLFYFSEALELAQLLKDSEAVAVIKTAIKDINIKILEREKHTNVEEDTRSADSK